MYRTLPLEAALPKVTAYVFAAAGAAAVEDTHTLELGTVYVVRLFGADIHVFPVLVSIFAMLAIRQLLKSRTESRREAITLTFALSLLQIATIVQFNLGVAYATALGFGIGAGGMALVNLFKDGVMRYYNSVMDRFFPKKDVGGMPSTGDNRRARSRPRTPQIDTAARADELDTTELTEALDRMPR